MENMHFVGGGFILHAQSVMDFTGQHSQVKTRSTEAIFWFFRSVDPYGQKDKKLSRKGHNLGLNGHFCLPCRKIIINYSADLMVSAELTGRLNCGESNWIKLSWACPQHLYRYEPLSSGLNWSPVTQWVWKTSMKNPIGNVLYYSFSAYSITLLWCITFTVTYPKTGSSSTPEAVR